MTGRKEVEVAVQSHLAGEELAAFKSYLDRGRRHASADTEALKSAWVAVMRAWAADRRLDKQELNDLQCELKIRQEKPPYDEIAADFALIIRYADEAASNMTQDEKDEFNAEIMEGARRERARRN